MKIYNILNCYVLIHSLFTMLRRWPKFIKIANFCETAQRKNITATSGRIYKLQSSLYKHFKFTYIQSNVNVITISVWATSTVVQEPKHLFIHMIIPNTMKLAFDRKTSQKVRFQATAPDLLDFWQLLQVSMAQNGCWDRYWSSQDTHC